MSSNNQCLNRIHELTNKIKTIVTKQQKPGIHDLRIERETKRWKQTINNNDKTVVQNWEKINQLIQGREQFSLPQQKLGSLKQKIISQLDHLDNKRRSNESKIQSIKKVQLQINPLNIELEQTQQQFDRFSNHLEIVSQQCSSINNILLQSIEKQFDKLEAKLQQQQKQQQNRNHQLYQCINALDNQFTVALQFQQKQLISTFQQHHHALQRMLEDITMTLEF